ncbi:MAG: TonB-dependent, partial [Chitinophagaceae bacterium]
MYKNALFLIVFIIGSLKAFPNPYISSRVIDTTLKEVVVTAFNTGQRWKDAPAAVAVLQAKELNTFSPVSMVPVMNTLPGVRMEERSPGSYRFSIRGSLLRSPFGVRNVKVYWNEIPISDATGNTYLNLLDLQQVSKVEIAKGPSASTYGAGTGGVVLFNRFLPLSDSIRNSYSVSLLAGSFGLQQAMAEWKYSNAQFGSILQLSGIHSNGYRDQTALNKTTISWQTSNKLKQQEFNTLFFYTNLKYQTPGAITKAQMLINPTLSRQAAGSLPGAIQQKTAVYNQTIFGAVKHIYHINDQLYSKSFLSINHTQFKNP